MDGHAEHWPPDHGLMLRPRGDPPSFCRSMLAEKLLSKGDYDCDREIRTLELLKLRFGEVNLLNCEARPALLYPAMSLKQFRVAPYLSACILQAEAFQVQGFRWQVGARIRQPDRRYC